MPPYLDHDKRIAAVEVEWQEGVKDDDNKLYNLHGGQIPRTSRTQNHFNGCQVPNHKSITHALMNRYRLNF